MEKNKVDCELCVETAFGFKALNKLINRIVSVMKTEREISNCVWTRLIPISAASAV